MQSTSLPRSKRNLLLLTAIAWLAMVGFDFLLHAGLLARLYAQPSPFLLPPATAFRLIPVGYVSFLLSGIMLTWLMVRLNLKGWRPGATFGLTLGALTSGAFVLGLVSISTASLSLLAAWLIGQTVEMGLGGAVIGSGLAGMRLRRLFGLVVVFVLVAVVATVVLQTLGVVPATRIE